MTKHNNNNGMRHDNVSAGKLYDRMYDILVGQAWTVTVRAEVVIVTTN
jgi:hypothetical protein